MAACRPCCRGRWAPSSGPLLRRPPATERACTGSALWALQPLRQPAYTARTPRVQQRCGLGIQVVRAVGRNTSCTRRVCLEASTVRLQCMPRGRGVVRGVRVARRPRALALLQAASLHPHPSPPLPLLPRVRDTRCTAGMRSAAGALTQSSGCPDAGWCSASGQRVAAGALCRSRCASALRWAGGFSRPSPLGRLRPRLAAAAPLAF